MQKNYVVRRKIDDQYMYYRSRMSKGYFHYVIDLADAMRLNLKDAKKLISEAKYPEKFEVVEVK